MTNATQRQGKFTRHPGADGAQVMPKIMVCTPMYAQQCTMSFCDSFAHLWVSLHASGIKCQRRFMGNESLITRARNKLVAEFLASDCTHMVFIDADIGFHPKHLAAMIKSGYDVVCGAYPKKNYGWQNIADAAKADARPAQLAAHGALFALNPYIEDVQSGAVAIRVHGDDRFVRVLDGATGFMVLTRGAVERFIAHYGDKIAFRGDDDDEKWKGKKLHMLFQAAPDPAAMAEGELPRYLSEDYWFCRMWQMMGGEVWLYLDAKLTHTGSHTWEGDVSMLVTDQQPAETSEGPGPVAGRVPSAPRNGEEKPAHLSPAEGSEEPGAIIPPEIRESDIEFVEPGA